MSIEKRIQDHMSEQAERIEIQSTDPALLTGPSSDRPFRAVGVLTGALVVLLAGAGFWMLSNDDAPVTEIAAGQVDEDDGTEDGGEDEAEGDEDDSSNGSGTTIGLQRTDVTSDNTPGYGQVEVHDGIYYVLSTAPGKVDIAGEPTEEQWAEYYRPRSFYILGQDNQWTVSDIGDRFVSDFTVDDGVIYVVSTGSTTGAGAAYGSSADQGRTWDWTPFDDLPEVSSMTLLVNDQQSVIYAARWGGPDWDQAIAMANDAGLAVDAMTIRDLNGESITYIPIDPADRCAMLAAQMVPEIQGYYEYLEEEATEAQRANGESDFQEMVSYFREELEQQGCEWNPVWESGGSADSIDIPDPVTVRWADVGVTVPETWKSWSAVYTFDGEQLTDRGLPYGSSVEPGGAQTRDGELTISIYVPFTGEESVESEDLWSTRDGVNWDHEVRRFDHTEDEPYYYYDGISYMEPRAGDHTFRLWWDESQYEEMELDGGELEQQRANGEITEQEMEERMMAMEPKPELQRRTGGGEWQTVTVAELIPGLDIGDRLPQDIRGTSLGVFLVFGNSHTFDGPPEPGVTVVHSSNGVDWDSFELDGNSADTYSGDNTVLVISNTWPIEEPGGTSRTQSVLITAED